MTAPALSAAFDSEASVGETIQGPRSRLVVSVAVHRGRRYLHVTQSKERPGTYPPVWERGRQELVVPVEQAEALVVLLCAALWRAMQPEGEQ